MNLLSETRVDVDELVVRSLASFDEDVPLRVRKIKKVVAAHDVKMRCRHVFMHVFTT